jgi:hypothetical protein
MINRYLTEGRITPHRVWENVKGQVKRTLGSYLVFDDTFVDKNFSFKMDLVRRQWSGDAHGVIKGIGVVTFVCINPEFGQFWIIDYRIYDPEGNGKTKLDHVHDMLENAMYANQLLFWGVLMDIWYATQDILLYIEALKKIYYCQLKDNRQVDDSGGAQPYHRVDGLQWTKAEKQLGKVIKIKGFPGEYKVKLFRVMLSIQSTDYFVTNDFTQDSTQGVQKVYALRWKIEQLHRKLNNWPDWKAVNVARLALFAIILAVPSWLGSVCIRLPKKLKNYLSGETWFIG